MTDIAIIQSDMQYMEVQLLDVRKGQCLAKLDVPMSRPRLTLKWIGFTEQGILSIKDSDGVISSLFNHFGWQWVPILDLAEVRKTPEDNWWVIGITGQQLLYVPTLANDVSNDNNGSNGKEDSGGGMTTMARGGEAAPSIMHRPAVRDFV